MRSAATSGWLVLTPLGRELCRSPAVLQREVGVVVDAPPALAITKLRTIVVMNYLIDHVLKPTPEAHADRQLGTALRSSFNSR